MKRCSPVAFAMCPDRDVCGSLREAVFCDGSDCEEFNEFVEKRGGTRAEGDYEDGDQIQVTIDGVTRLTDCAQGYCEMYCKKYGYCFGDPGDCIFKDEVKMYEKLKSIEGIVTFDRLLELAVSDKAGQIIILPCKVGDTVLEYLKEGAKEEAESECPPK